jgi:hypothetical protein
VAVAYEHCRLLNPSHRPYVQPRLALPAAGEAPRRLGAVCVLPQRDRLQFGPRWRRIQGSSAGNQVLMHGSAGGLAFPRSCLLMTTLADMRRANEA